MDGKKIALCVLLISSLILVLALPLALSATVTANPYMTAVGAKSPDPDKMNLVKEGTVFSEIMNPFGGLDLLMGEMDDDVNIELVIT